MRVSLIPPVLILASVVAALSWIYVGLTYPGDETGDALGVWLISTTWAICCVVILVLSAAFSRSRKRRWLYLSAVLSVPLAWFLLPAVSFHVLFRRMVDEKHPGWLDNSSMASDGLIFMLVASALAAINLAVAYSILSSDRQSGTGR